MDGLLNLSNIAAEMPRLDCSSNDKSSYPTQGTGDEPTPPGIETPESALFRRLSSFTGYNVPSQPTHQQEQSTNYIECRGGVSSIYPSPLASFNISTGNTSLALAAAIFTNPGTAAVPTAMGGYSHAIAPFSSTLDEEYYKSQEKLRQVYINNVIAASARAATSASAVAATGPIHSGTAVVPSVPPTLSTRGGLLFDQHRPSAAGNMSSLPQYYGQQQPGVGSLNDHQLSFYFHNNNAAVTTTPMMDHHVNATAATNYAATLRQEKYQNQQFCQPISPSHNTLFLPSDANFLSEAHCFIRFVCIELFTSTEQHLTAGGRGARPTHVGQVGFRCIHCKNQPRNLQANQAVSFPSTRDNIFESVRNFQRVHLESCPFIPSNINQIYQEIIHKGNHPPKRSHKLVRAYYSQAASEMGLIDAPFGLRYRDECGYKQRTTPSQEMLNILEAAKAEEKAGTRFVEPFKIDKKASPEDDDTTSSSSGRNAVTVANDVKFGKFDALSSKLTKQVILNARKETTVFVQPQDFPTISDFIFLLFHQLKPCKPKFYKKRRRICSSSTSGLSFDRDRPNNNNNNNNNASMPLAGLCCKHCQKEDNENPNGMYFPSNVECLGDSSFSQTLLMHLMSSCPHVPQDIKHALTELKNLAREYKASVKRGSKKKFVEKVWDRLGSYAKKNSGPTGVVVG